MTANEVQNRGGIPWRLIGWGGAAGLLLLPLVAGAPWTGSDYVFAAVVFGVIGGGFELAVRMTRNIAYRAGAALALLAALLLVWINAAVGIIGSEKDDINLLFLGVIAIELAGSVIARGRAAGMARALIATAVAQAAIAVAALPLGLGANEPPGALGILILNGFFVAMFAGAALLFRRAAREQAVASAPA